MCSNSYLPLAPNTIQSLALVGPYPPPYGGISTHVSRLKHHLREAGIQVKPFPNKSARRWLYEFRERQEHFDLVHFHDTDWLNRTLIGAYAALGHKTILTIHGDSLQNQVEYLPKTQLAIFLKALRRISHFIVVKPEIKILLISLGIAPDSTSVIHSYLPPPPITAAEIENIHPEIKTFIKAHPLLVVANGFGAVPFEHTDLYGIDLSIGLCADLSRQYPALGFLFFLAQRGNEAILNKANKLLASKNVSDRFMFVFGQPLLPVLSQASIFIRPTYQDGFGISVAEAIDLGIPAIASDACQRATGAILFSTGNLLDLKSKTLALLHDYETYKNQTQEQKIPNPIADILAAYRAALQTSQRSKA